VFQGFCIINNLLGGVLSSYTEVHFVICYICATKIRLYLKNL